MPAAREMKPEGSLPTYRTAAALRSCFLTKSRIRVVPSRSRSSDVAYEMRRNPGASNPSPAVSATRASSSSICEKSPRARDARRLEHLRDAREQVERPARLHALEPRIVREPLHQLVAARLVFAQHRADRILRSGQRLQRGLLRDRRDVRRRVPLQRVGGGDDFLRAENPAAAPAGHRVRLRRRAADDRAIAHAIGEHLHEVVRHVVVNQLLVAQVDDRPRCRAWPPHRRSRQGSLRRSPRRSGSPAS